MVEKGSSPEQQPNPAVVEGDKNNSKKSVSVEAEEQRLRERLKHRAEEKRRKNSTDNDKDKEGKATKDQDNNNNNNSKNDDDTASKKRKHNDVVENDNEDDDDEKSPSKNRNGSRRRRRRGRRRRDRENAGRGGGAGDNRNGGRMSPQNWNRGPPPGLPPNFRDRGPPPPGWNDWDRGLPPPPPSHYGGRYGGGPGPGPGPGGPPPRGGPDDWRSGPPHPRDRDMWERDRFYDRRGNAGGGSGGGPSPPSRYGGGGGGGPGRRSRSRSRSSHSSGSSRSYSSDSRSPSRSRSRSSSRSRSPSSSVSRSGSSRSTHSYSSSHDDHSRGGGRRGRSSRLSRHRSPRHRRSRRRSRSPSADSYSSHSSGSDSNSSLSSSSTHSRRKKKKMPKEELEEKKRKDALTKDQRTVFVSQLIMRTTEKDLKRFFKKSVNCKVNDVILLKDKRTGRHKGCAYVELGRLEDVPKAIAVGGKPPDFQRFPILVKASEAEKNYVAASIHQTANAANGGSLSGAAGTGAVLLGADGKAYESQRAYIGNLDRTVTADHLKVIFSPFGQLVKIHFQKDPATGLSRGFAFLQFREPTAANLAIQTMAGQILVGRPLKTGWANQTSSVPGVELRTSEEFPDDAPTRISNAHLALAQVQGIPVPSTSTVGAATATVATAPGATAAQDAVASVAEAALDAAFGGITAPLPTVAAAAAASAGAAAVIPPPVVPTAVATTAAVMAATAPSAIAPTTTAVPGIEDNDPKKITGEPSANLLVHNMFNKDEETEQGWEEEIRLDFEEECAKYGKISSVTIMSKEPGGKIYATFETIDGAKTCASTLAGRWFDKRQLRVEYVRDEDLPSTVKKSS